MKVQVTLTASKAMELDIPEGGTAAECDASAISTKIHELRASIFDNPALFIDDEAAKFDVLVEL